MVLILFQYPLKIWYMYAQAYIYIIECKWVKDSLCLIFLNFSRKSEICDVTKPGVCVSFVLFLNKTKVLNSILSRKFINITWLLSEIKKAVEGFVKLGNNRILARLFDLTHVKMMK